MKNILITGGAGFIGSNLTRKLVKKGYNVTIYDNLSKQVHGKQQNSSLYLSIKDICLFIKGDVSNKSELKKAVKSQDAIIHLAAETGTGQSMYEIGHYSKINIGGTANLLEIINEVNGIKKLVVASSRAIYGEGKYICEKEGYVYPENRTRDNLINSIYDIYSNSTKKKLKSAATDELSMIRPISIYGITKQHQEQMSLLIGKLSNVPTVSLRYQNVYGPGQSLSNPYTGILSIFSTRLLNGNNLEIYEDGNQSRDFVYIDDVVDATILALENKSANNQVFNVGSGTPTTVLDVAEKLQDLYSSKDKIIMTNKYRFGDIRHNFADLTKINKLLNYSPKVDFNSGIQKFFTWVLSQDIMKDKYDQTQIELTKKGLIS